MPTELMAVQLYRAWSPAISSLILSEPFGKKCSCEELITSDTDRLSVWLDQTILGAGMPYAGQSIRIVSPGLYTNRKVIRVRLMEGTTACAYNVPGTHHLWVVGRGPCSHWRWRDYGTQLQTCLTHSICERIVTMSHQACTQIERWSVCG